jgi:hypothetical protein
MIEPASGRTLFLSPFSSVKYDAHATGAVHNVSPLGINTQYAPPCPWTLPEVPMEAHEPFT